MAKDETIKTMQEASTPKEANTKLQQISDEIENIFRADENGEAVAKALGQEYDNQINTAIK